MLTLTTCNPKWDNYQRMVVHAKLVSDHAALGRRTGRARELADVRMDLARACRSGVPGKLFGAALLSPASACLFWYVVFPAIDPLLPFNDVQVTPGTTP